MMSALPVFRMSRLLVLALAATTELAGEDAGAAPEGDDIVRLVRQLDDESFAAREAATQELIAIGEAALPPLRAARQSPSAEVRYRASMIVEAVVRRDLDRQFALLAEGEADVDIEHGMWLIARIVDSAAERDAIDKRLDVLAKEVCKLLGEDVDPPALEPAVAVAALRKVLFEQEQFTGNTDDYDNPDNSSIDRVLRTRQGLPILLSHVVIAVGRRLEWPIVGMQVPGRYMCKYDGRQALGGETDDIVLDPFGGGRIVSAAELQRVYPSFDPDAAPADTHRAALRRMLRNLAVDFHTAGQRRKAAQVERYEALFASDNRP